MFDYSIIQQVHLLFQTYHLLGARIGATQTKNKCEELLTFYMRMMPSSCSELSKFLVDLLRCELVSDCGLSCRNCTLSIGYCFEGFVDADNGDKDGEQFGVIKFLGEKAVEQITIDQVERRLVLGFFLARFY